MEDKIIRKSRMIQSKINIRYKGELLMITPVLESKRMILRPLSLNDANHIFKSWTSDPEVAKFMIWDIHKSVDDTIEWLKIEEGQ